MSTKAIRIIHALRTLPVKLAVLGLISLTVVGGYWLTRGESSAAPVTFKVSWAVDYESMGQMLAASDVVVTGEVVGQGDAHRHEGPLFTDWKVRVDQVLAGDLQEGGTTELVVRQTGGLVDGTRHEPEGARLLSSGEKVLLFLVYDGETQRWFVTGGRHGHFELDGGALTHANFDNSEHPVAAALDGRSLTIAAGLIESEAVGVAQ